MAGIFSKIDLAIIFAVVVAVVILVVAAVALTELGNLPMTAETQIIGAVIRHNARFAAAASEPLKSPDIPMTKAGRSSSASCAIDMRNG